MEKLINAGITGGASYVKREGGKPQADGENTHVAEQSESYAGTAAAGPDKTSAASEKAPVSRASGSSLMTRLKITTVLCAAVVLGPLGMGVAHAQEAPPPPAQAQTVQVDTTHQAPKAKTAQTGGTQQQAAGTQAAGGSQAADGQGALQPADHGATGQGGDTKDPDPHAHDFGRFHIGGDVDSFDADHSKGIDAGDWQSPLDNFQGGFLRGEVVRNFRVDGLTLTHGDSDKGSFAGVEIGGLRARSDNDLHLSLGSGVPGFGNLNGDRGFNAQIEGDETIGVNLFRYNAHITSDLGNGNKNEVGTRGFVNGTFEYDVQGNWSSSAAARENTPNGFQTTTRAGIGGRVEGYDVFTHDTDKGTVQLEVHAGAAANLAGQGIYDNKISDDHLDPYAWAGQSYTFKGGTLDGVTVGAREDWQQTSQGAYTRVAGQITKDTKIFGQDATVGVYAGHEELPGAGGSNFVGAGITFHW